MLTEDEKGRIRYHLGYAETSAASGFSVGGAVQPFEPTFLVEAQLNKVMPIAESRVRMLLQRLDDTEQQIFCAQTNVEAQAVGNITVNLKVQMDLENFYLRWRAQLCNLLSVFPNPFDKRYGGGGGIGSVAVA